MSLDNIQLPSIVLQDLFRKSLVDLKTNEAQTANTKSIPFRFLGDNKGRIAILVNSKGNAYLPEDELNFLSGVLNACKLNLSDIALVNLANHADIGYSFVIEKLNTLKFILFDINCTDIKLPFSVPDFQVQKYDSRQYLPAPAIGVISADKLLKKKLWDSLRLLFEII